MNQLSTLSTHSDPSTDPRVGAGVVPGAVLLTLFSALSLGLHMVPPSRVPTSPPVFDPHAVFLMVVVIGIDASWLSAGAPAVPEAPLA